MSSAIVAIAPTPLPPPADLHDLGEAQLAQLLDRSPWTGSAGVGSEEVRWHVVSTPRAADICLHLDVDDRVGGSEQDFPPYCLGEGSPDENSAVVVGQGAILGSGGTFPVVVLGSTRSGAVPLLLDGEGRFSAGVDIGQIGRFWIAVFQDYKSFEAVAEVQVRSPEGDVKSCAVPDGGTFFEPGQLRTTSSA